MHTERTTTHMHTERQTTHLHTERTTTHMHTERTTTHMHTEQTADTVIITVWNGEQPSFFTVLTLQICEVQVNNDKVCAV